MFIEGWFTEEEGLFYKSLVAPIKDGIVVEIGSWKGLSTSYIAEQCNLNHTILYCFDWWKGSLDCKNDYYQEILAKEDVEQTFRNNMSGYDIDIFRVESITASKIFRKEIIDLVFLDASHDYDSVTNDLEAWFPKIKPNGIFSGHDYGRSRLEVTPAVDRFATQNNLELKLGSGSIWYFSK